MSEFPEVFNLESATEICFRERDAGVLAEWLLRGIQEVRELKAQIQPLIDRALESDQKVRDLEALERFRKFKESKGLK